MGCGVKCPCAETCDLGRGKINKKIVYETLQRSIMISAIEAVDGKMSMVAEIYGSCVHACVVLGEKRGAVGFRFLPSEYKHVLC
jgi:hypothetical protein